MANVIDVTRKNPARDPAKRKYMNLIYIYIYASPPPKLIFSGSPSVLHTPLNNKNASLHNAFLIKSKKATKNIALWEGGSGEVNIYMLEMMFEFQFKNAESY